jgi:hypothetical protein
MRQSGEGGIISPQSLLFSGGDAQSFEYLAALPAGAVTISFALGGLDQLGIRPPSLGFVSGTDSLSVVCSPMGPQLAKGYSSVCQVAPTALPMRGQLNVTLSMSGDGVGTLSRTKLFLPNLSPRSFVFTAVELGEVQIAMAPSGPDSPQFLDAPPVVFVVGDDSLNVTCSLTKLYQNEVAECTIMPLAFPAAGPLIVDFVLSGVGVLSNHFRRRKPAHFHPFFRAHRLGQCHSAAERRCFGAVFAGGSSVLHRGGAVVHQRQLLSGRARALP